MTMTVPKLRVAVLIPIVMLFGFPMLSFGNNRPPVKPKLPGHLDPGDLDPGCLQGCYDEYFGNIRDCGEGLACYEVAQAEFDSCIGNCLADF